MPYYGIFASLRGKFMYIFHYAAIGLVIQNYWEDVNFSSVLIIDIVLLTIMIILGYFLKTIKSKKFVSTYLFRLIFGGK